MTDTLPGKASNQFQLFPAFALVWACTTLVHQLAFTFWTESWQGWLLVLMTFGVILRPSCFRRFFALIVTSLLNLGHKVPFVPNHILYEGILHITMLLGVLSLAFGGSFGSCGAIVKTTVKRGWPLAIAIATKFAYFQLSSDNYLWGGLTTLFLLITAGMAIFRGPATEGGERFFSDVAPVVRVAVVMMYFWAAIQKMNWDYLDPAVSCAAKLHIEIVEYFPFSQFTSQLWALHCAIWGSLIFELGIPILLMARRLRLLGFLWAVGFHLWLSIHHAAGIYSYSSLIFALLVFFLPTSVGQQLQGNWKRQLAWLGRGNEEAARRFMRWAVILLFMAALITQALLYVIIGRTYETFWTANRVGFCLWFTWGLWLGGCYLVTVWQCRKRERVFPNRAKWTLAWLGLTLVVINGLNPWFGAKTQTSFAMYSNLRSEAAGNHCFLSRIDLFPFQNDMVQVFDSSPDILGVSSRPRGIQQFANEGTIFPYFELRRMLSEHEGDVQVTYRRGDAESLEHGELLIVKREGDQVTGDAQLFDPSPYVLRKYLWFRRHLSLTEPMHCTH